MAYHMKCLYTIIFFTITESVLSLPLSAPLSNPRGPYFTSINGPNVIMAGVPTKFVCSAQCTPECTYIWQVAGRQVEGNVLTVTLSGQHETLTLECIAINPTSKDSQSTTETVRVDNPVLVRPTTSSIPQEGQAFTLACIGSGPGITTVWHKDDQTVTIDSRMLLGDNNATLTFSSLLPSDGGMYGCVVTNSTIRVASREYLLSFGTITATILGPDTVEAGVEHIFTCQANCTLDCSISWRFKQFPQGSFSMRGGVIHWTPARAGLVQDFLCIVENSLAQRSVQANKTVTVVGPPPTPAPPPPPPPTPSSSVMERPSLALVSMVCMQLLFALSA